MKHLFLGASVVAVLAFGPAAAWAQADKSSVATTDVPQRSGLLRPGYAVFDDPHRSISGSIQQTIFVNGPTEVNVVLAMTGDTGRNLLVACEVQQSPQHPTRTETATLMVRCGRTVAFVTGFAPELRVEAGSTLTFTSSPFNDGDTR
jgi:hypothetical protein